LNAQTDQDFTLVLIDDGSTDGTSDAVLALRPQIVVLRGTGDWWWAGALAAGCDYLERHGVAGNDLVLLINDDVAMAPDFLASMRGEFAALADTLLLARQVDAATGDDLDGGGGVHANLDELRFAPATGPDEINCLPTRGLLLRWRDLLRIGRFKPRSLPHYLSDYEFTLRAHRLGYRLQVARTATVAVRTQESGDSISSLWSRSRPERFKLLFSRRFKDNPVTWSSFARLAAKPSRRPYLWAKIWVNFALLLFRAAFRPVEKGAAGPH
jgi:GT2 family glycosyltransferase